MDFTICSYFGPDCSLLLHTICSLLKVEGQVATWVLFSLSFWFCFSLYIIYLDGLKLIRLTNAARPSFYNYVVTMFVVNVLGLFASGLSGIGFGFGFWYATFWLLFKSIFNLDEANEIILSGCSIL